MKHDAPQNSFAITGQFSASYDASLTVLNTGACEDNLDCEDADPCTRDLCDADSCEFPARLYGDADADGDRNIVDVLCVARVAFQDATECGG